MRLWDWQPGGEVGVTLENLLKGGMKKNGAGKQKFQKRGDMLGEGEGTLKKGYYDPLTDYALKRC